jgi:hypothetical protein
LADGLDVHSRRHNVPPIVRAKRKPVFQALVVYEDFAAGRQATDTCNLLMAKLGDEFELRCSMWKFEVLRNAKLNQMAAAEATEADAIIIAVHGASPLPEEVTHWIEAWLPLRDDHPAALIALVDSAFHRGDQPSAAHDFLRGVAAEAKMDFLTQVTAFTRNESGVSGFAFKSDVNATPAAEASRWNVSERHWGINE